MNLIFNVLIKKTMNNIQLPDMQTETSVVDQPSPIVVDQPSVSDLYADMPPLCDLTGCGNCQDKCADDDIPPLIPISYFMTKFNKFDTNSSVNVYAYADETVVADEAIEASAVEASAVEASAVEASAVEASAVEASADEESEEEASEEEESEEEEDDKVMDPDYVPPSYKKKMISTEYADTLINAAIQENNYSWNETILYTFMISLFTFVPIVAAITAVTNYYKEML